MNNNNSTISSCFWQVQGQDSRIGNHFLGHKQLVMANGIGEGAVRMRAGRVLNRESLVLETVSCTDFSEPKSLFQFLSETRSTSSGRNDETSACPKGRMRKSALPGGIIAQGECGRHSTARFGKQQFQFCLAKLAKYNRL